MKVSSIFTGLILSFLVVLLAFSWKYPVELKLLPWVYIFIAMALGGVQIVKEKRQDGATDPETENDIKFKDLIANLKRTELRYLKAIFWVLGFLIFLYLFGFLVSAPLFTVAYLKTHGESWKFSLGLSIAAWGIFFIIFIYALHVRLYEGQLYLLVFS